MKKTPEAADQHFVSLALKGAIKAQKMGEVPVGALLVRGNEIIARGSNCRETKYNPLGHAEIEVIRKASKKLKRWRLNDCTLYVTLEPCVMCAGAIVQARIGRVVYGAKDPKAGAVESIYEILSDKRLNHRPAVTKGVLGNECGLVLKEFFAKLRKRS